LPPAFAQSPLETKQRFVAGLIRFMEALPGTFGDEGTRLTASLDEMEAGLRRWDAAVLAYESDMRQRIPDAQAAVAAALHVSLGAVYLERRRIEEALGELAEASRLEPGRPDVQVFRALAYQTANKPAEAADAFRAAWRANPGDPVAAYRVAREDLADARSADNRSALLALLALQRQQFNRDESRPPPFITTELLDEPAVTDPVFAPALYASGFALVAEGRYDEALARFREAVSVDPLTVEGGLTSEATRRGIAELRNGRLSSAIRNLEAAIGTIPDSPEIHRILATALAFDDQLEASVEHLEMAIRLNPRDERSRLSLADTLVRLRRGNQAERVLRDAIRIIPSSATARWNLGTLLRALHRDGEALRAYEDAAAASLPLAGASRMYAIIGRLHVNQTDFDQAVVAFSRRLAIDPNDAAAHRELGDAYRWQGRQDQALAEYLAALLINPADAEACAAIGQIHLSTGRYAEAHEILRQAVDLRPGFVEARYGLANALLRLGRTDEGGRELQVVGTLQAEALEERHRAYELSQIKLEAELRFSEGQYEEASALWKRIVDRQPNLASNFVSLGHALAGAGHLEAAIESFGRALALDATPELHRFVAEQHDKLGRREAAEEARARYRQLKKEQVRRLGTGQ
jgi:tetratricopeptide (TPR) repeat protein